MRNKFAECLYEAAIEDESIYIIVADISPAGSMEKFREHFPDRFINVGVAEQAMIGISAGLARESKKPFAYTIAAFSVLRPYEFIRDDISLANMNVTIVGIGAGLIYSTLGPTHHTIDDVALMSILPKMKIYSPADSLEVEYVMKLILESEEHVGPKYLRIGKAGEGILHQEKINYQTMIGNFRPISLKEKTRTLLISYGTLSFHIQQLRNLLETEHGITADFVTMPLVYPIKWNEISEFLNKYENIFIYEEHLDIGSIGMQISSYFQENSMNCKITKINLGNNFIKTYGTYNEILDMNGFNLEKLASIIQSTINTDFI